MPKGEGLKGKRVKFGSGQPTNRGGRKRNVIKHLEAAIGKEFSIEISKDDKFKILESMCEMSISDLANIATDKKAPVFMVNIATALKEDIKKGRIFTLNDLFDRFFGKSRQVSEVTATIEQSNDYSKLNSKELLQLRKLQRKANAG